MIKTITAYDETTFDEAVNNFEKETVYNTGVSRVFATQTHVTQINTSHGPEMQYTAIIFYRDSK